MHLLVCIFLHGKTNNNLINLLFSFPNVHYFDICHFKEIKHSIKNGLLNALSSFPYQQNGIKKKINEDVGAFLLWNDPLIMTSFMIP